MKAWITKYALTKGIYEEEIRKSTDRHIYIRGDWNAFLNRDWHKTKEAAIEKAEAMRAKKIESLKKQIEKLERMQFE